MIFTEGVYFEGSLSYLREPIDERPTRISGNFVNSERDYEEDYIPIHDPDVPPSESYREQSVSLWGCQRPIQVIRQCEKILNRLRIADATVEFEVGYAGFRLRAGDIIGVA